MGRPACLFPQAFEILELYLELLAVRAELLGKTKEIPGDMVEVRRRCATPAASPCAAAARRWLVALRHGGVPVCCRHGCCMRAHSRHSTHGCLLCVALLSSPSRARLSRSCRPCAA